MRCICPGHGNSARKIFQPVICFIDNRGFSGFLLHIFRKPAALDHKPFNYPVKNGVAVKSFIYIGKKVFNGFWCSRWILAQ